MRLSETLGEDLQGLTRIHETLGEDSQGSQDFGRGFARIHETWERICKDL